MGEKKFGLSVKVTSFEGVPKKEGKSKRVYHAECSVGGEGMIIAVANTPGTALHKLGEKVDRALIQAQLDRLSGDSGD